VAAVWGANTADLFDNELIRSPKVDPDGPHKTINIPNLGTAAP
jgi:hypothetical protein